MNNNLSGKIIIVTGAQGLLGKAFVKDIKQKGGVPILADIKIETDIERHSINCDITSNQSIKDTLALVIERFGRLDGIVNNAYPRTRDWGISLEEDDLDSWRKNVDMQLTSHVAFCKYAMELMVTHGIKGSIVNIASTYGVVGNDPTLYEGTAIKPPPAYSAIKGGIINFTRFLAGWYGKTGIRFNCVSPGGIFDHQDPAFVNNYSRKVPLGRMGNPEDVAPVVSFLLSDEAGYITGQNIIVDGGWTIV